MPRFTKAERTRRRLEQLENQKILLESKKKIIEQALNQTNDEIGKLSGK